MVPLSSPACALASDRRRNASAMPTRSSTRSSPKTSASCPTTARRKRSRASPASRSGARSARPIRCWCAACPTSRRASTTARSSATMAAASRCRIFPPRRCKGWRSINRRPPVRSRAGSPGSSMFARAARSISTDWKSLARCAAPIIRKRTNMIRTPACSSAIAGTPASARSARSSTCPIRSRPS